ncbi:MAG: amidohydrolase family protein [Thermoanaerobaculia bacterium]
MRRGIGVIPAAIVSAVVATAAWAQTTDYQLGLRENDRTTTAFTHARVVVAPGRVIEDATLVVRGGLVTSVRAGGAAPAGARVVDLGDRTVYPGFIDPYTEYGLSAVGDVNAPEEGDAPRYAGRRSGLNSWNDTVHAERRWVESFVPDADAADAFLARGVTTVQSAKLDGIFRGLGFVTSLGGDTGNQAVLSPESRQFASFDRGSSSQQYPNSLMGSIALVRQTLMDADWYPRALAAWERDRSQERPELNLALAALAANEDPLIFETDDALSLLRAGRIADETGVAMVHVGAGDEYRYLDDVARIAEPLILPATFPEAPDVGSYESSLDVDLSDLRLWERAPHDAAALADAGVTLAFTARGLRDGEDFLANIRTMVDGGLDENDALAALTTVPARIAGVEQLVGTLEPGKRADFVVVDGDLFAEGSKPVSVWIGGERAKQMQPLDPDSYAGSWRLSLGSTEYTLEISGEPDAPKGTLSSAGEEISLEGVSAEDGRLAFRASLPEGLARVTLLRLGDTVRGEAAIGASDPESISLTALAATPSDDDGESEEAEGMETADADLVSRMTHPDVAFGFEELPEPEDVLVRNATVWTVDEQGTLENADLLVRNGKIAAVGHDLEAPDGVRVIDGTGKHVTPGMIDEHSHIAIQGGVNEGSNAVTAEVRIADVVLPTDIDIYRNLSGGTTIAQLLHGSANPIGGQAQVVKLRWGRGSEEMKFEAAPPTIKFALGENVKQSNWGDQNVIRYPQTRMGVETLMRDRFLAARDYADAWERWNRLSSSERNRTVPPRRDLQLEALAEILASQRFIHCHSYVQSEILMLMRLAEELGFRVQTFTHILEGYKVAPEMAAHGAGASTFSDWWAYKFEVYDAIPQNTCLLTEAGVVTSINSDSSDLSRRLNTEAGKSVLYCGMPEEEAIELATINPAKQLKIDHRVGSLTPGKDADFVIWDGDPLSMHTRAEQTWIDGTLYFSRERDEELRSRDREERAALTQKVLAKEGDRDGEDEEASDEGAVRHRSLHHAYDCDDEEDYWNARIHS